MINVRKFFDASDPRSLSNKMRAKRFRLFEQLLQEFPRPIRIIDIGGTTSFWEQRGWAGKDEYQLTLVNLRSEEKQYSNIVSVIGDATDLSSVPNSGFDVAFSNSVIEHLFTFEKQAAMAREIQRIARRYWVQTPNYWFPVEPHFHVPGWQWLPLKVRIAIIQRVACGWRGPCPDPDAAAKAVTEVRLMKFGELVTLFPLARIVPERFMGLVKSWIAIGGFENCDIIAALSGTS